MKPFAFEEVPDFDNHIVSSIPTFDQLNYIVSRLAHDFAQERTWVMDVGCSTGRLLRSLNKRKDVIYFGIDKDMDQEQCDDVFFEKKDVFNLIQFPKCSVIISMFTAQFMPFHKRDDFFDIVNACLVEGGIFICAEKMHFDNPSIESVVQANLLEWKKQHFTDTEIIDKAIGLKSVMHCDTQRGLRKSLDKIGTTDCVWQWGAFGCFVSRKK
jgi:tRNA (cmo5U34)-methyltransferase